MSVRAIAGEVPAMAEGRHEAHHFARGSPWIHREIPRSRVTTAGVFEAVARLPRRANSGPWPWRSNNKGMSPVGRGHATRRSTTAVPRSVAREHTIVLIVTT